MPSLIQLQYALTLEKVRHFGKASAICSVTQPTLSQQLQKLEDEVGIILFDRLKKPILPTPEGKAFLDQAKIVVREHQKLLHISKQRQSGEVTGDFRLGIIPTISSHLLPLFVNRFSKTYPGVQLFIEELKTDSILEELASDRLDGAILATPLEESHYKVHPLYYESFYVYFSLGHSLLKKAHIARDDLDSKELWLLQDGHCFKNQILNFCSLPAPEGAVPTNVFFQSGSLDTLRRLVQNHEGYTLIPALMALTLDKKEFQGQVRPFKAPVPSREVSMVHRRDHWKLEMIQALEKVIGESLPKSIARRPDRSQMVLDIENEK